MKICERCKEEYSDEERRHDLWHNYPKWSFECCKKCWDYEIILKKDMEERVKKKRRDFIAERDRRLKEVKS